nr:N-acetyltransferase [Geothrix sp. SG200]
MGVPLIIRPETAADIPAIDRINLEAFQNHPYSRQTEHLIVRALRASGALTLSLVAERQGQVVGHIAFSPALIQGEDLGWYTLGPVAVLPSHQRQGIGASLIRAGLDGLRSLGANGCLLVGDPAYYTRFGFRHVPSLGIHEVPPEYVMCLPFTGDVPSGLVTHHPAFFTTA